jgi:hypothetical protein
MLVGNSPNVPGEKALAFRGEIGAVLIITVKSTRDDSSIVLEGESVSRPKTKPRRKDAFAEDLDSLLESEPRSPLGARDFDAIPLSALEEQDTRGRQADDPLAPSLLEAFEKPAGPNRLELLSAEDLLDPVLDRTDRQPVPRPLRLSLSMPPTGLREDVDERPRRSLGIAVLTLALGLALGFAAGYWFGQQARGVGPAVSAPAQPAAPTAPAHADPIAAPAPRVEAAPRTEIPVNAAAAATAPTPAGEAGRLLVRSSPSGAAVWVDGNRRGTTPAVVSNLPFGSYTIRVALPGYAPKEQQISLSAERPTLSLEFPLQEIGNPR